MKSTSGGARQHFVVALFCLWGVQKFVLCAGVNVTVQDTHPSILYTPSKSWSSGSTHGPPRSIASVGNISDHTYHIASRLRPATVSHAATSYTNMAISSTDSPVAIQFDFTGSAIYLYHIQPLDVNAVPIYTNLTFTLDDHFVGSYSQNGSQASKNVFIQQNLTEAPHTLLVNVEADSTFVFDFLTFTRTEEVIPRNNTLNTPLLLVSQSQTDTSSPKHRNIATFGGAVGGSVGVLSLVAMSVAFSIIRRRKLAARRDRLRRGDRASLRINASEDSPHMIGPAPFVPRFFPGSQIPSDPPYSDLSPRLLLSSSLSGLRQESFSQALFIATVHRPTNSPREQRDASYADIPPPPPSPDISISNFALRPSSLVSPRNMYPMAQRPPGIVSAGDIHTIQPSHPDSTDAHFISDRSYAPNSLPPAVIFPPRLRLSMENMHSLEHHREAGILLSRFHTN